MARAASPDLRNLECSICTEMFIKPKILPCRHSFCESCIHTWILRLSADSVDGRLKGIECPLCRVVSPPPVKTSKLDDWAKMLPNNFAVMTAMESAKESGKRDLKETITEVNDIEVCGACASFGEESIATVHCVVCTENLCRVCADSHRKLKATRSHEMFDIDTASETRSCLNNYRKCLICPVHPDKEIEFHCRDDDSIFCATCAFLHHRGCEDVVEIGKETDLACLGANPHLLVKRLRTMEKIVKEIVEKRQQYEQRLKDDVNELPVRLKDQRKTLMRKFDKFEKDTIAKGRTVVNELLNQNKDRMNQCTCLLDSLQSSIATAQHLAQKGKHKETFIISRMIEEKTTEIKEGVNLECSENTFEGIVYEENKKMADLVDVTESFGSIQTKDKRIKLPALPEDKSLRECNLKLKSTGIRKTVSSKPHYRSCSFCPYAELFALADQTNKRILTVSLLDEKVREMKLKPVPYAVKFIGSNLLAVTFPKLQQIWIFSSDEMYKQTKTLSTKGECYALDSDPSGALYVTVCQEDNWWISIIDIDSDTVSDEIKDLDGRLFKSFLHMKVDHGHNVYQPCQIDDVLYCFDWKKGSAVFQYKHKSLICPGGVDVDIEGNVYVCGIMSRNVHVLTAEGDPSKVIQPAGCSNPVTIALSLNGEDVVVLGNAKDSEARLYKFAP